jgi:hypothetical protein
MSKLARDLAAELLREVRDYSLAERKALRYYFICNGQLDKVAHALAPAYWQAHKYLRTKAMEV